MDLFSELQTVVYNDLTAGTESSLFPSDTVKLAINRSYRKAGALFRWPQLEDAKKTSTVASGEYYDYPETWRPDSIWKLEVGDEQYGETPDGSPLAFEDYLVWRRDEDNASSTDKKWANQKTRYFIYPVPTTNGSNNISIWGFKNVVTLSADGDTTIFSYNMPECNEAIVLEAVAILKAKGEKEEPGAFRSAEAKQILISSYNKLKQEQNKYERNQPFFHVNDMFGRTNSSDNIGDFN